MRSRIPSCLVHSLRALLAMLLAACASGLQAGLLEDLAPPSRNPAWWKPADGDTAVYMPSRAGSEGPVLTLDKQALARCPVQPPTLDLRSNARSLELISGARRVQIHQELSGRDRLSFVLTGPRAVLRLNRAELPDPDAWFQVWSHPSPELQIRLIDATEAAFSIVGENRPREFHTPPQTPGIPTASAPSLPKPLPPKTTTDAVLLQARNAAFEILIQTPTPGVRLRSIAFCIDERGFAVTPLGPLREASAAAAILPENPSPVPLELWDARPALDLALIRLQNSDRPMAFLPIAPADPAPNAELWALGIDEDGRSALATGKVTRITPWARLPDALRSALDYDNLSHWIEHTAPLTLVHSGGPLIDERGQLAGIAVWYRRASSSEQESPAGRPGASTGAHGSIGLLASHVRALLETRPETPIGFAGATWRLGQQRSPHHSGARIDIRHPHQGEAAHLRLAAKNLARGTVCPLCKGEGRIPDRQKILQKMQEERQQKQLERRQNESGSPQDRTSSRRMQEPDSPEKKNADGLDQDLTKPCPNCDETGFQQAEEVFGLGTQAVMALAAMNRSAEGYQDARVYMEERLLDLVELNPQGLARHLNNQARRHLHSTHLRLGTPVLLMGVAEETEAAGLVRIQLGSFDHEVLVLDSQITARRPGGIVLAGGVLSGYLDNERSNPIPVLQRGFVLKIDNEQDGGENLQDAASKASAWKRFTESRRVARP